MHHGRVPVSRRPGTGRGVGGNDHLLPDPGPAVVALRLNRKPRRGGRLAHQHPADCLPPGAPSPPVGPPARRVSPPERKAGAALPIGGYSPQPRRVAAPRGQTPLRPVRRRDPPASIHQTAGVVKTPQTWLICDSSPI